MIFCICRERLAVKPGDVFALLDTKERRLGDVDVLWFRDLENSGRRG